MLGIENPMALFFAPRASRSHRSGALLALGVLLSACSASNGGTSSTGSGGSSSTTGPGATASASSSSASGAGGTGGGIELGGFGSGTGGGGASEPATDVQVVITADNAYSFGYGDSTGITHFTQGTRAQTSGEIFNCGEGPEAYLVPAADAPPSAYLYIVTWDDLEVTQGVLGQFVRVGGNPLYTGDPKFEVCATGIDLSQSTTGPSQTDINTQIGICNAGSGDHSTTSGGWVNGAGAVTPGAVGSLAVGEANDATPGGTFPPACVTGSGTPAGDPTIDAASHWMWYQPGGIADPFESTGSNTFRAYLIFRVAAHDLPPPIK